MNPDTLTAQFESGVVFALSSIKHAITIEKGRVAQSNFNDYPMLRIGEMPVVEVELIKNDLPPGGAGEPGVPGIAPAIANALFAATGKRFRSLPLELKKA